MSRFKCLRGRPGKILRVKDGEGEFCRKSDGSKFALIQGSFLQAFGDQKENQVLNTA